MGEDIEEFFLNTKPVRILVSLRQQTTDNYASSLSTQVDATYSHTIKVIQKMEEFELVSFEKKGRKKMVELTSQGERLAEKLHEVIKEIKRKDS